MLYKIARLLQLLGLILVPVALAGNLADVAGADNRLSVKQMLVFAGLGVALFYLGYLLQQRTRPQ